MKTALSHVEISTAYSTHIQSLLAARPELTAFFVTTKIKYVPLDDALSRRTKYPFLSSDIWKCYSRFYRHLTSQLAKNWQNKRHLMPLTFDCLDIDHSRKTKSVSFSWSTIPHIHSVYLVHSNVLPKFQSLADEQCAEVLMHPRIEPFIESVHIEPVTSLDRLTSYQMKFAENHQLQRNADDIELVFQQPIALCETTREQNKALLKKHPEQRDTLKIRFPEQRIKRLLNHSRREMNKRFSALPHNRRVINTMPKHLQKDRKTMKRNIYSSSMSFRCSPRLLDAIETFADERECHSSNIIREAVIQYLKANCSKEATQR